MTNRKLYNTAIVNKLVELVNKYPDLRFGQILVNCDIIELVPEHIHGNTLVALDPFNEESEITWKRMSLNKFAFKELYN